MIIELLISFILLGLGIFIGIILTIFAYMVGVSNPEFLRNIKIKMGSKAYIVGTTDEEEVAMHEIESHNEKVK